MTKKLVSAVVCFVIVLGSSYYWLMLNVGTAVTFDLKLDEIRALAKSQPGSRAQNIRVEQVAMIETPASAIVAGDPIASPKPIPIYAYQLNFPSHSLVIDTGLPGNVAEELGATSFDQQAYSQVLSAMALAQKIVVTHEHSDHMGGLFYHPERQSLLEKAVLPLEQITTPAPYAGLDFNNIERGAYKALVFESTYTIAPGVVLIKAPGHTAGSLMIYVVLENDTEFLFVGDIAWHYRNIELKRSRSRLASQVIIQEDHGLVLGQVEAIASAVRLNPDLIIVPGHDLYHVEKLINDGFMKKGFHTKK